MIDIKKLSEAQRTVAELIGAEAYSLLVKEYGGENLYIPSAKMINRAELAAEIRKSYTGSNAAELAQKYGFSQRTIMRIIRKKEPK